MIALPLTLCSCQLCFIKVAAKIRREGGGCVQVDRSQKQHLNEIYCLQIQMLERNRKEGKKKKLHRGFRTVQVKLHFAHL